MYIRFLIFDLDGTLYNPSKVLEKCINDRIIEFVKQKLNVSEIEAALLKKKYSERYGLTGKGLEIHNNVNFMDFLNYVYDIPIESFFAPDPTLARVLSEIECDKVIFTNSIYSYAVRTLKQIGIFQLFSHVYTLETTGFVNKPNINAYEYVLKLLKTGPKNCIYFDDLERNLIPAQQLGVKTVLVHPQTQVGDQVGDILEDIHDIKKYWIGLSSCKLW